MTVNLHDAASRLLRWGLIAASLVCLGACLAVMLTRLVYPYETEWIEGSMVDGVARVMADKPLYAPPSLEFIPQIYAPLFTYASAAVASATGLGFFPGRLISLVSTLVSFVLIYRLGWRDSADRAAGFVAVGLLAAMYRATGTWFDSGRVDGLAIALALGGAVLARAGRSTPALVGGACLLGLSIHTKQSMVFIAAGCALYVIWQHKRRDAAIFLAALGSVAVLLAMVFVAVHGHWYAYYVYQLPMAHAPYPPMRLGFWTGDLLGKIPVITVLAAAYLPFRDDRAPPSAGEAKRFYLCLLAGAIGCSWLTRMNAGAWVNVLIPAYVMLCLLAALTLARLWRPGPGRRIHAVATAVIGAGIAVQFVMLGYRPLNQMPTSADRAANDLFVRTLRGFQGDVWVLSHGYVGVLAGKPPHAHWQAVADVLRTEDSPVRRAFQNELATALRERRFAAIVTDGSEPLLDVVGFHTYYRVEPWSPDLPAWPRPVTGTSTTHQPRYLFVPRQEIPNR